MLIFSPFSLQCPDCRGKYFIHWKIFWNGIELLKKSGRIFKMCNELFCCWSLIGVYLVIWIQLWETKSTFYALFVSFPQDKTEMRGRNTVTQCISLPVLLLLWILNQTAIQIFHIAIADCNITVQEEQRRCLGIWKWNHFWFCSCWWKSWPQTGGHLAGSHPRWEITSKGTTTSLLLCCFLHDLNRMVSSTNLLVCSTFVLKLTGSVQLQLYS